MKGRPRHWLNPHYQRSETEASTCRSHHSYCQNFSSSISLRTESSMKKVESRVRSILTGLPKSWAKLNTLTNSLTSILTSRSEPKDEKEVVMEGVLPTTKASLMSFLKGMGLRPKVELVGQETIISADMSVIHDESLKRRFLDVIKMQVIETPAATNANSNIETSEPSFSSMHVPTQDDKKNHHHFGRKRHKSTDSLAPEQFKPDKPEDPHRRRQEVPRTSIDSLPPGPFKPDKPHGTLPPGPYRTEKQIRRESAMRRTSKPKPGELPPGPFLPEHPGEPLPPGSFKPRKSGADDLPPVPWGPKKKRGSAMSKKSNHEDEHNLSQKSVESQSQTSHEEHHDGTRRM
uniref:Chitin synthase 5 n=2 Tax=Lygus hesperus TaxID=30085 RepID=A0A0A9XCD0_LYGHE